MMKLADAAMMMPRHLLVQYLVILCTMVRTDRPMEQEYSAEEYMIVDRNMAAVISFRLTKVMASSVLNPPPPIQRQPNQ